MHSINGTICTSPTCKNTLFLQPGGYPCHTVRSSEAFIALACAGVAYCLIPRLQIAQELASGALLVLGSPPTANSIGIAKFWSGVCIRRSRKPFCSMVSSACYPWLPPNFFCLRSLDPMQNNLLGRRLD